MHAKPALAKVNPASPSRRPALELAAQTASTSFRDVLPPKLLSEALRAGEIPSGFEPHIAALLDEAPLSLLSRVAAQLSADAALPEEQVWANMRAMAAKLKITRKISMLESPNRQQARTAARTNKIG